MNNALKILAIIVDLIIVAEKQSTTLACSFSPTRREPSLNLEP